MKLLYALTAAALAALPPAATAQTLEPVVLPESPGWEEVEAYCSACHSLHIVVQQGLDRESWKEVLVWMEEEQGMPSLGDDEAVVLDYLSTYFGPNDAKKSPN